MAMTGEASAAQDTLIDIADHLIEEASAAQDAATIFEDHEIEVSAAAEDDVRIVIKIPRVPERLRRAADDVYEPTIISLGPYHRGKDRLQDMEEHKQRYLQAILSRCQSPLGDLENKIKELEVDVRRCYSKDIGPKLEKNGEFVNMMMLDGCFIVEYFLRIFEGVEDELSNMIGVHRLLWDDMLLLENQLPFFLLNHIFNHVKEHQQHLSQFTFMYICITHFKGMLDKDISLEPPEPAHLLHLYHSLRVHSTATKTEQRRREKPICEAVKKIAASAKRKMNVKNAAQISMKTKQSKKNKPIEMIPSATLLQEHGITFKKNEAEGSSILDIKFSEGVLEIPPLIMGGSTKLEFRNLIAFEQLYPRSEDREFLCDFTVYAMFLDHIVDTPEDIALLYQNGILQHHAGSDKAAADLFNNLVRGAWTPTEHYLSELYEEVKEYHDSFWPRSRANLMHKYFNTPWAGLSVAAAVILLILTILQTVFTAISTF